MDLFFPQSLYILKIIGHLLFVGLFIGQIFSVIYVFGLWENMPKRLRITSGIFQILAIAFTISTILNPSFC